jgi:hypothetical protein
MDTLLYQFRDRFRRRLATIRAFVSKRLVSLTPPARGYALHKDVPVLRVNHAAGEDVLSGVREVTRSGYLTRPLVWTRTTREGDQRALDDLSHTTANRPTFLLRRTQT